MLFTLAHIRECRNLHANAGDMGSSPGLGRFHMLWSNKAHVPQLLSLSAQNQYSTARETTTMKSPCTTMKRKPHFLQLEKALTKQQRPSTAKKINKLVIIIKQKTVCYNLGMKNFLSFSFKKRKILFHFPSDRK